MKKILPFLLVVPLLGCASSVKYDYKSATSTDPEFIFGDRFGGGAISSPARSFDVNTGDLASNKCSDYARVGTTSNHWMGVAPKTIQVKVPAGKPVAVAAGYLASSGSSMSSCLPPIVKLQPKDRATYSIDIAIINKLCMLSIVEKLPDGKTAPVPDLAVMPACQK